MDNNIPKKRAILLAGGGARAAYQVGVIKAIAKLIPSRGSSPFQIVCGSSAGALNAAALASFAHDFQRASTALTRIWANFHTNQVIRSDFPGISKTALRWLTAMAVGGLGKHNPLYLFDRKPLRELLDKHMPLENLDGHIEQGLLHALGITCSGYSSGESLSFFQAHPDIQGWSRSRRKGTPTNINVEHLLASSAIPFLFEAVKVNREYFGDGSIRQTAPFSLPIHLGADSILAIGSRSHHEAGTDRNTVSHYPSLGQIAGFALDSIFLDSLQSDLERLMRINHTLSLIPEEESQGLEIELRPIEAMLITPSTDLGEIAHKYFKELPWTIRSLMRGMGSETNGKSSNLISYLMFEKGYCRELIALGYEDAMQRRDELVALLGLP